MSLIFKPKKNYTEVTSSYFEDYNLIKQSMREVKSEKWINKKDCPDFNFGALDRANAIQLIMLAKNGAREVSQFVDSLSNAQLNKYKFNYGPWKEMPEEEATDNEKEQTV